MPRRLRVATGGIAYHVLNRAVGRNTLFHDDADYAAFVRIIERTAKALPMRICSFCLMPNHWHLVLWPKADGQLSEFMRLLTVTHTQRWHAHHHSAGTGPVYQGRFKSFPIQQDDHFLIVSRYVERNAKRAKKVKLAERWQWCSLAMRESKQRGRGPAAGPDHAHRRHVDDQGPEGGQRHQQVVRHHRAQLPEGTGTAPVNAAPVNRVPANRLG